MDKIFYAKSKRLAKYLYSLGFPYELVNEKIILKDKLVLSYQEMSCSKCELPRS